MQNSIEPNIQVGAFTAASHSHLEEGQVSHSDSPRFLTRRVLHLINGEHFSGAERVQDLLALNLKELGFEVGFACTKQGRFQTARTSTGEIYQLPMSHKFDLRVVSRVCQIIRKSRYDLIHAHTPRCLLIGRIAAGITRTPIVYHVHSPAVRDSTGSIKNRVNHTVERLCLRGVNAIIPVSQSLGRHMHDSGWPLERLTVVPNGVPAPQEQRSEDPPAATWRIGTVALFRPRKGLEVLLRSLAKLRDRKVPVVLHAVGPFETEDYERQVRALVAQLKLDDRIRWTGFTADVAAEMTQLDLFALPSLFGEGLPMVVLEALAAGVPVVGTKVEGVPEAIFHGENGLLAEPSEPQDLANQIQSLVQGDYNWSEMRNQAIQIHRERFSAQSMAAGTAAVYQKVLG